MKVRVTVLVFGWYQRTLTLTLTPHYPHPPSNFFYSYLSLSINVFFLFFQWNKINILYFLSNIIFHWFDIFFIRSLFLSIFFRSTFIFRPFFSTFFPSTFFLSAFSLHTIGLSLRVRDSAPPGPPWLRHYLYSKAYLTMVRFQMRYVDRADIFSTF